jgi:hypothetical protein
LLTSGGEAAARQTQEGPPLAMAKPLRVKLKRALPLATAKPLRVKLQRPIARDGEAAAEKFLLLLLHSPQHCRLEYLTRYVPASPPHVRQG